MLTLQDMSGRRKPTRWREISDEVRLLYEMMG
jgi:hypothetical protein